MTNVIKDLSTLTTIPEKTLNKLNVKLIYIICESILEDVLDEKDISELDIGIGTLYIKHVGEEVKYKFVPSPELEKAVTSTVVNKLNLMENVLNETLAKKFIEVYKDIC